MSRLAILRLKSLILQYGPTLAVGFALLGMLLVGVAGWEYTNPETTEVTDHTNKQTVRSELHTSAITTGNTSLYTAETKLRDQPVYLIDSAPSVTLIQRTTVPENQAIQVEQDIVLRYQVVRDGSVFWQESHLLVENETTTSNGTLVTKTSLDIRELQDRRNEIESEVKQAGTVRTQLVVTISYETNEYTGDLSKTIPIQLTDSWYSIEGSPLERTHSTSVTRRVPIPTQNPLEYLIPGGAGGVLLAAAVAIGISYRRGFDQQRLKHQAQERRFAEWISTGSISDSLGKTTVSVDSLEGLVDIAIDTDNRVIHDENYNVYVVIDSSVVYYYSPDGFLFPPSK